MTSQPDDFQPPPAPLSPATEDPETVTESVETAENAAPRDDGSAQPQPIPVPTRTLPLLLFLLGAGTILLLFANRTVHRRSPQELRANGNAERAYISVQHWIEHGFFRTGGLPVRGKGPQVFHRSSIGGRLISLFIVEKIYSSITGHYSWRLAALHNQMLSLLSAALLGLLAARLARRLQASPLHALALGLSILAVQYTFPTNLASYWETTGREGWLLLAAVFLLIEDRCVDGRTPLWTIAQGVTAFLLVHMDLIAGIFFLASYAVVALLLGADRSLLKRIAGMCVLPIVLVLALFAVQLKVGTMNFPDIPLWSSGFLERTGLDGSSKYYTNHLDIAYARHLARANFPHNAAQLFRWKWLFFASTIALAGVLIAAMRGRVPRVAVLSLFSLLGSYALFAAIFSQSVVIHPYLYDVVLFAPLMLALFAIVPALIESVTEQRGVAVAFAFFLAVWVTTVQLRAYALWYPLTQLP